MCYTKTASGRCMRASAGCRNLFYQNHCRIPCGIHSVFSNTFIFDAENEGKEGYLYSLVTTSIIQGIKSIPVYVEADVSDGMPLFEMVGSLSPEVKESKERVRTALKNTGYILPPKRITINFIPANIRKTGSGFDLPVVAAVLCAIGIVPEGGKARQWNTAYGGRGKGTRRHTLYRTGGESDRGAACKRDRNFCGAEYCRNDTYFKRWYIH